MSESKEQKIVIAISHSEVKPWDQIKIAQEKTWVAESETNSQVIFYVSKPAPLIFQKYDMLIEKYRFSKKYGRFIGKLNTIVGNFISHKIPNYLYLDDRNELIVNSWSTYQLFGRRNLALFDWFIKETDAEFLFQTNVSSYIKVQNLQNILKKFSAKNSVYAGVIINPHDVNFSIVSGAGKLLSRKLVSEILINKEMLKFDNLEDVALAELIGNLGVKAVDLPRLDLPNLPIIDLYSNEELGRYFHFRCKSESRPRIDGQIMQALHDRLSGKRDN